MAYMSHKFAYEKAPEAEYCLRRRGEMKSIRSPYEADFDTINRLIRGSQHGDFSSGNADQKIHVKALCSEPIIYCHNFGAGLFSTNTNPATDWMKLRASDPDFARWKPMQLWQDTVTERILASFRPAVSNFYSSEVQHCSDIAAFGNAAHYSEMTPHDRKIMDMTVSLAQVLVDIDAWGRVSEVILQVMLTPERAAEKFGKEVLPIKMQEKLGGSDHVPVPFFMHVFRNQNWQKGKLGAAGKRWTANWCCEEGCTLVHQGGFNEMPFDFTRWNLWSGQTYATGQGHVALPSARILNLMQDANLRAGQRAADPTILAPDRDSVPLNGAFRPGSVVYGGVDFRGNKLIASLDNFSGTGLTLEMQQRAIATIQEAFSMMTQLQNRTGVTEIEALEIKEDRIRMMAPYQGRVQEEHLAPVIARRFTMLWEAGQLPPPPPEAGEGMGLEIQYENAAASAQKSTNRLGISRLFADIAPLVQAGKTGMLDRFSEDDLFEILAEAGSVPARATLSREEAGEVRKARQQQEQMAQMLAAAQAGGGVVKDLAQAGAAMQGGGGA
jgi:hypothetical protein